MPDKVPADRSATEGTEIPTPSSQGCTHPLAGGRRGLPSAVPGPDPRGCRAPAALPSSRAVAALPRARSAAAAPHRAAPACNLQAVLMH